MTEEFFKSIILYLSEAASVLIFPSVSGCRSPQVLLHCLREDDHFFHHHYNIEQVHLKVSFSKNYYEVFVFPNYCKQDTLWDEESSITNRITTRATRDFECVILQWQSSPLPCDC